MCYCPKRLWLSNGCMGLNPVSIYANTLIANYSSSMTLAEVVVVMKGVEDANHLNNGCEHNQNMEDLM